MIRTCALAACGAALSASAAVTQPSGLANALRVRPGEQPAFALRASGAQLYQCGEVPGAPGGYGWFLSADYYFYKPTGAG